MEHCATTRSIAILVGFLLLLGSRICIEDGYAQALSADERARLAPQLRLAAAPTAVASRLPLVERGASPTQKGGAQTQYGVFVRTTDLKALQETNLPVRGVGTDLASARLTPEELRALAQREEVTYVQPTRTYEPMNDVVRGVTGIQAIQEGVFGRQYTGENVLACVIDTGIDWSHRDFREMDDSTRSRIRALWDQTLTPRPSEDSPGGFGYGVEYTRRDIEGEIDDTPDRAVRSTDTNGHGTHVAGTIAGNGAAGPGRTHRGMAPEADIVAVKTDFTGVGIADGIRYCGGVAEASDQPVVVNLSLGTMAGPHDGSAPLAQVISDFVGPGRSAVVAAGNGGEKRRHVTRSLSSGTADSLRIRVPRYSPADGAENDVAFHLDTWIDGSASVPTTVVTPGGTTVPVAADSAASVQTPNGTVAYENAVGPGDDRHVELLVHDAEPRTPPVEGRWTIVMENNGSAAKTMHGWMVETTTESVLPGGNRRYTLTTPATAQGALSVGAWTQRGHWQTTEGTDVSTPTNQLEKTAAFSGRGPLRGEAQKPDLVAPGQWNVSARSRSAPSPKRARHGEGYVMRRGTSTAAATATGAVALLFEQAPSLSASRAVRLLTKTAEQTDDDRPWTPERGHGRLDLFPAMAELRDATVATRTLMRYDAPATGEDQTTHTLGGSKAKAMAVRFTPSRSGVVTGLYLHTAAGPANQLRDSLTVELRADTDGVPGRKLGPAIQVAPDALSNHTMNFVSLTETGVVVRKDTDYHVVIEPGTESGTLDLMGERRLVDGRSSVRRGGKWSSLSESDLALRVSTALALELRTPQLTAPQSAAVLDATEPVTLSWNDVPEAESYTIHVSPSRDFPSARTDTLQSQTPSVALTDLTPSTAYHWRVRAERLDYAGSWSSKRSFVAYPSTIDVEASRSFGAANEAPGYRLVALPGQTSLSLSKTVDGKAGETWQAFWDTGSTERPLVAFEKTARFRLRPGNGFWLRSDSRWSVQTSVPTVSLSEDGTYAIELHDGWNVISNPFELDVPWRAVEAVNDGTLPPLWRYSGSFEPTATLASARAGEAFYFLNDQGRDALQIPYPAAPDTPSASSGPPDQPSALVLSTHQRGTQTARVRVGIAKAAEDGRDALDRVAPPARFAQTTLHLEGGDTNAPARQQRLAAEYRPAEADGHTFSLVLRTEWEDPVELQAEGLDAFEGKQVVLVDPSAGESYDLRTSSSVTIEPEDGPRSLRLLVGSSDYVEAKKDVALPSDLQFLPNRPNPFREQTTLEYVLPDPASVRLAVYDVLGRQVRVLVDGKQKAGRHTVQWDGHDESGKKMASGVYLARLVVGGTTKVRKMTFVR